MSSSNRIAAEDHLPSFAAALCIVQKKWFEGPKQQEDVHGSADIVTEAALHRMGPVWAPGCKNRPTPYPGRMS